MALNNLQLLIRRIKQLKAVFFNKDGFGIKQSTNVDMPLNKYPTKIFIQIQDLQKYI